jgi:NitT/TauT family transport system substrate-binding protein
VVLLLGGAGSALAGDEIVINCGGPGKQIYLPVKLAEGLGYFRDEGLEVRIQSETADSYAEDQMLAGAVSGVIGFYGRTIELQAHGEETESVVQFSDVPGEMEMVSAHPSRPIASPADFAGKRLGVTAPGASTEWLTRFLALTHGVKNGSYSLVPVGAGNHFIAAMREGRIDAGMTTEPTVTRLLKAGDARVLLDLRRREEVHRIFGGPFPGASLFMESDWVRAHHEQVRHLVRAFVRTLRYIREHDAGEIAGYLPSEFFAGDRAGYVEALQRDKDMFLIDGRMPEQGPATVLKVMAQVDPALAGRHVDLARTYTNEFADAAARP